MGLGFYFFNSHFGEIPVSLLPAIDVPRIVISASYSDHTASEIEAAILKSLREALLTTDGLLIGQSGIASINIKLHTMSKVHSYFCMTRRAILKIPARKTLLVPKEAVVIRGNRPVVFTVEGNLAKWNYVEIGRNNGVEIEIISGLTKADQVIVSNNLQLAHEAAIKIE